MGYLFISTDCVSALQEKPGNRKRKWLNIMVASLKN
jgi:hypothetical protein